MTTQLTRILRSESRLAMLLLSGLALFMTAPNAIADEPPFVPRQALIQLAPGQSIQAFHTRYGTTTLQQIQSRSVFLVALPGQAGDEPEFVDNLALDPTVVRADLNYVADIGDAGGTGQSIFLFRTATQYRDDPAYAAAGVPSATVGSGGAGVIVAVIDSGVDATHPDLAGRIDPRGYDFILRAPGSPDVGDGLDNNADGRIDNYVGHGTAVAGIIRRVAPQATILPIRAMNSDGDANIFALTEGVYYAIEMGARVINISMGTYGSPDILAAALAEARDAGISVVAAAGNDGISSPAFNPAGLAGSGVVSVTAVSSSLVRPEFSNFGPWIGIAAPGVSVVSTLPGGMYGAASGTSFAAPFISATLALVRAECTTITPDGAIARLFASATPLGGINPNYADGLGAGSVQSGVTADLAANGPSACTCVADFDRNGALNVADLLEYLNAWFSGIGSADLDGNGVSASADIFIFLNAWFNPLTNRFCKVGGNTVDAANIDDIFIFLSVWFAAGCG